MKLSDLKLAEALNDSIRAASDPPPAEEDPGTPFMMEASLESMLGMSDCSKNPESSWQGARGLISGDRSLL